MGLRLGMDSAWPSENIGEMAKKLEQGLMGQKLPLEVVP